MDALLRELVAANDGVVTTRQLTAWGVHRRFLAEAVRGGSLVRVGTGTYLASSPGARPEVAHLRRALAVLAGLPAPTVLTHHSALAYWGLPTHRADLQIVHVGRIAKPSVNPAAGRRWHRLPAGTPLGTPLDADSGGRATAVTPAVAAVQVGLSSPRAFLVAADSALRNDALGLDDGRERCGVTTRAELTDAVALYRGNAGIPGVRRLLGLVDARAESPAESLLRHDVVSLGHPVEPQYVVRVSDRRHYRADLRICGTRVLCEYDGEDKYELTNARSRSAIRQAERERERDLRRLGWKIARFTARDLGRYDVIRQRLREAV